VLGCLGGLGGVGWVVVGSIKFLLHCVLQIPLLQHLTSLG